MLLQVEGCDPDREDENNMTPLLYAAKRGHYNCRKENCTDSS